MDNQQSLVIGIGDFACQAIEALSTAEIKDTDILLCYYKSEAPKSSKVSRKIKLDEDLDSFAANYLTIHESLKDLFPSKPGMVFFITDLKDEWSRKATLLLAQLAKERDHLAVAILPTFWAQEESFPSSENNYRKFFDAVFSFENKTLKEQEEKTSRKINFTDYTLEIINTFRVITDASADIAFDLEDLKVLLTDASITQIQKGRAAGKDRAIKAFNEVYNRNRDDFTRALLFFQSGNNEISMDEIFEVTDILQNHLPETASVIWGAGLDHSLKDEIIVSLILN
jgi:cell division protein FtsZ